MKQLEKGRVSLPTVLGIVFLHAGAIAAIPFFTIEGLIVAIVLYILTGCLGVCIGYHRLFTHRSFKTSPPVRWAFAVLGGLSMQSSVIWWVTKHRQHHEHSDTDGDPHSPLHGAWWSHMFWLVFSEPREEVRALYQKYVPDLLKERGMRIISTTYVFWHIALALVLFLVGTLFGGLWVGFSILLWGMCLRTVVMFHATWAVNSASHMWGTRRYVTGDGSRNNWWVALISFGEGWHNNHHAFPTLAKHGQHRWWEIDISYWIICALAWVGLAWDVKRHPPPEQVAA